MSSQAQYPSARMKKNLIQEKNTKTLIERFYNHKPSLHGPSNDPHQVPTAPPKALLGTTSLSGGSGKSVPSHQGISQSLMYLNKNREKLLMTSS